MTGSIAFFLKKALSVLLLPPASLLLLMAAGLLLARRHRRSGLALTATGLLALYALSTPLAGTLLERLTYVRQEPVTSAELADAGAIVVLGGGTYRHLADYGGETVSALALERVRAGAALARQTGLPVLVSGGVVWSGRAEGELMQSAMRDFGVEVKWVESRSRDTADNATMSAGLLRPAGITRVVLVTHAVHMRRSIEEFRNAGLDPVAAPTVIRRPPGPELRDLIPDSSALKQSAMALHEWLGWLAQKLRA